MTTTLLQIHVATCPGRAGIWPARWARHTTALYRNSLGSFAGAARGREVDEVQRFSRPPSVGYCCLLRLPLPPCLLLASARLSMMINHYYSRMQVDLNILRSENFWTTRQRKFWLGLLPISTPSSRNSKVLGRVFRTVVLTCLKGRLVNVDDEFQLTGEFRTEVRDTSYQ